MPQIIESIKAHYSTLKVPFGRVYSWHQAQVSLECDCGEKITFSGTSAITTCQCGADYGSLEAPSIGEQLMYQVTIGRLWNRSENYQV